MLLWCVSARSLARTALPQSFRLARLSNLLQAHGLKPHVSHTYNQFRFLAEIDRYLRMLTPLFPILMKTLTHNSFIPRTYRKKGEGVVSRRPPLAVRVLFRGPHQSRLFPFSIFEFSISSFPSSARKIRMAPAANKTAEAPNAAPTPNALQSAPTSRLDRKSPTAFTAANVPNAIPCCSRGTISAVTESSNASSVPIYKPASTKIPPSSHSECVAVQSSDAVTTANPYPPASTTLRCGTWSLSHPLR